MIGDVVQAEPQVSRVDPSVDHLDTAEQLAEWCDGEVTWTADDLAVVRSAYETGPALNNDD